MSIDVSNVGNLVTDFSTVGKQMQIETKTLTTVKRRVEITMRIIHLQNIPMMRNL